MPRVMRWRFPITDALESRRNRLLVPLAFLAVLGVAIMLVLADSRLSQETLETAQMGQALGP